MAYKFNPFTSKLEEYGPILTGTGTVSAAADGVAALPGIAFTNDLNTGIYRPGADQLALSTNGTGRLFIDASGNVGVGLASTGQSLAIQQPQSRFQLRSTTATNSSYQVYENTAFFYVGVDNSTGSDFGAPYAASLSMASNYPMLFKTNNQERLRITEAGLVGIGTSSPQELLHIGGATNKQLRIDTGSSPVYIGGFSGQLNLAANRRTVDGSIIDSTRSSAFISVVGTTGPSSITFATASTVNTAPTVQAVIDGSGRVGIGTTSPLCLIDGRGGADGNVMLLRGGSTRQLTFGTTSTNPFINADNGAGLEFQVNGSPRAVIDSSGTFRVKGAGTGGVNDAVQLNGSAPANSLLLDASGRLLVGTSSSVTEVPPDETTVPPLQVSSIYGASLALFRNDTSIFANNAIGGVHWYGNHTTSNVPADIAGIQCYADGNHAAGSNPTRLVFSVSQDGSASPTERLRISNDGFTNLFVTNNDGFQSRNSAAAGTANACFVGRHSASNTTTGTTAFIVWSNGNVVNTNGSYGTISDAKLKENIVDANSQWDDIKALKVRNYNFKEGQTHTQIGLVAQEAELVSPGLVSESPDRDAEGNDLGTTTKSVNLTVLYMKAVKALQEAMERIELLEARLDAANL